MTFLRISLLASLCLGAFREDAFGQNANTLLLRPGDHLRIDSGQVGRLTSKMMDSLVIAFGDSSRRMSTGQIRTLELAMVHRRVGTGALIGTLFAPGPGTLVGAGIGAAVKSTAWGSMSPPRLKLESTEWNPKVGTLSTMTRDAFIFIDDSVPKAHIRTVSISTGQRPLTAPAAYVGAGAGMLAGVVIASQPTRNADLGKAVAGMVIGALGGGIIGHHHTRESWEELPSSRWH
jgi:hypothetical protein